MEVRFEDTFLSYDEHYAICVKSSVGDQCVRVPVAERGVKPPEDTLEKMRQCLRNWLQVKARAV